MESAFPQHELQLREDSYSLEVVAAVTRLSQRSVRPITPAVAQRKHPLQEKCDMLWQGRALLGAIVLAPSSGLDAAPTSRPHIESGSTEVAHATSSETADPLDGHYVCDLTFSSRDDPRGWDTFSNRLEFDVREGKPRRETGELEVSWKMGGVRPGEIYLAANVRTKFGEPAGDPEAIAIHYPTGDVPPEGASILIGSTGEVMRTIPVPTHKYLTVANGSQNEVVGLTSPAQLRAEASAKGLVYLLLDLPDDDPVLIADLLDVRELERMQRVFTKAQANAETMMRTAEASLSTICHREAS